MSELVDKHVRVRRELGLLHRVEVRSHTFTVDEPPEVGGSDTAASPLELLAAALGACTASTIELYAERKGWDVGAVEVDVDLAPPRAGERARFDVTLRLPAVVDPERLERLEEIGRKCPVRRTLAGADVVDRVERPG